MRVLIRNYIELSELFKRRCFYLIDYSIVYLFIIDFHISLLGYTMKPLGIIVVLRSFLGRGPTPCWLGSKVWSHVGLKA